MNSRERQPIHHAVQKPRELKHDAQLYRAYLEEADRLREEGANIHRVVLENDLKREYQEFLQGTESRPWRLRRPAGSRAGRDPRLVSRT